MGETDKIEDRIVKEEISNAISALQKLEKAVMYISRQLVEKSNNIDDLQALSNIADGDYIRRRHICSLRKSHLISRSHRLRK